jgi:UDP-glucose 4-epimerase
VTGPLRIALTGATGFIGQRVAQALVREGHSVRALVRDVERARALPALAGCELATVDLEGALEPQALSHALTGVSVLCHAAAYIPANQRDSQLAARCLQVNALATLSLVDAAISAKLSRLVHFSSGNVYEPAPTAVTEDAKTYPASRATYYLASKLCGELYVDHARRRGDLATTILRVSSVYGPAMKGGVVPLFADRLARGERVKVSDGGRYQTDLVFVDDVVSAAVRAIERPTVEGPINVGSGRATTLLELARAIAALTGRDESAIEVEPAQTGPTDLGFAPLDVSRARALLGYTPTALSDGLRAFLSAR